MELSQKDKKNGISQELVKRRLHVFSSIARDESPASAKRSKELIQEALQEEYNKENALSTESDLIGVGESGSNLGKSESVPAILKSGQDHIEGPTPRRRIAKYYIQASKTLKVSLVKSSQLSAMQEKLSTFGAIQSLNTNHKSKGIIIISYFDIQSAQSAFKHLQSLSAKDNDVQVAYVYDTQNNPNSLSSIHESTSDLSKSDRSGEDSDSEKAPQASLVSAKLEPSPPKEEEKKTIISTLTPNLLEQDQRNGEDNEIEKPPLAVKLGPTALREEEKKVGIGAGPPKLPEQTQLTPKKYTPFIPRSGRVSAVNNMTKNPLALSHPRPNYGKPTLYYPQSPYSSPSCPGSKRDLNKTTYCDKGYNCSETSTEMESINENVEISSATYARQSSMNKTFFKSPGSSVLHAESTSIDSEEPLSGSGRFDWDSGSFLYSGDPSTHSRKNSQLGQTPAKKETACFHPPDAPGYFFDQSMLMTQPVKGISNIIPMHTHNKSHDGTDLTSHHFEPPQYMTPSQFPYYPPIYRASFEPKWEDSSHDPNYNPYFFSPSLSQPYVQDPGMMSSYPLKTIPGRRKCTEKAEDRLLYTIHLEDILNKKDSRTTLMIRNIPNKYTQKTLLKKIDEHCRRLYDFFYLPIDFQNKCNVGYAFINFISPLYILSFYERFNAKKWEKFNSEKICQLTFARLQGKEELIHHFQSSSVIKQDKNVRPLILAAIPLSPTAYAEYEKQMTKLMTPSKIQELEELNSLHF